MILYLAIFDLFRQVEEDLTLVAILTRRQIRPSARESPLKQTFCMRLAPPKVCVVLNIPSQVAVDRRISAVVRFIDAGFCVELKIFCILRKISLDSVIS